MRKSSIISHVIDRAAEIIPQSWIEMQLVYPNQSQTHHFLIHRIWSTLLDLLTQLLDGYESGNIPSVLTPCLQAFKHWVNVVFTVPPTSMGANRKFHRHGNGPRFVYRSKTRKMPESSTSEPPIVPTPTSEQLRSVFQQSEPYLEEFFDIAIRILANPKFDERSLIFESIKYLLLQPLVCEWFFSSSSPSCQVLVERFVDSALGLLRERHQLTPHEEEQLKRFLASEQKSSQHPSSSSSSTITPSKLHDPRIETLMMNFAERPFGLLLGADLLACIVGFASESKDAADGRIVKMALEKVLTIIRRWSQQSLSAPLTVDLTSDSQYEVRSALMAFQTLTFAPRAVELGLITTELMVDVFDRIFPYLVRATDQCLIYRAGISVIEQMAHLPLALFSTILPHVCPKLITALRDANTSLHTKHHVLTMLLEYGFAIPSMFFDSSPSNEYNLPSTLFECIDNARKLSVSTTPELSTRIELDAMMVTLDEAIITTSFKVLLALATQQQYEMINLYKPYARRHVETIIDIFESATKPTPILFIIESCTLPLWNALSRADAISLMNRFHCATLVGMNLQSRTPAGYLTGLTVQLRDTIMGRVWGRFIEYFRLDGKECYKDMTDWLVKVLNRNYLKPRKIKRVIKHKTVDDDEEEEDNEDAVDDEDDDDGEDDDNESGEDDDDIDDLSDDASAIGENDVDFVEDDEAQGVRGQALPGEFLDTWCTLGRTLGKEFYSTHEKVLAPLFLWHVKQRTGDISDNLPAFVHMLPYVHGLSETNIIDHPIGEPLLKVKQLGANTKTLIARIRQTPRLVTLEQLIQHYSEEVTTHFAIQDRLIEVFCLGYLDIGANRSATESDSAPRRLPLRKAPAKKATSASSSTSSTPEMAPEVKHASTIEDSIHSAIVILRGGCGQQNVFRENNDLLPDEAFVPYDNQTPLAELTDESHVCNHRCVRPCYIDEVMTQCQAVLRFLGVLSRSIGNFLIERRSLLMHLFRLVMRLGDIPTFAGNIAWFLGDLCHSFANGRPGKLIPDWTVSEVIQPSLERIVTLLERPFEPKMDIPTRTSFLLPVSDFLNPDSQLPPAFFVPYLPRIVNALEQQMQSTYRALQQVRSQLGLESQFDEYVEKKLG